MRPTLCASMRRGRRQPVGEVESAIETPMKILLVRVTGAMGAVGSRPIAALIP